MTGRAGSLVVIWTSPRFSPRPSGVNVAPKLNDSPVPKVIVPAGTPVRANEVAPSVIATPVIVNGWAPSLVSVATFALWTPTPGADPPRLLARDAMRAVGVFVCPRPVKFSRNVGA